MKILISWSLLIAGLFIGQCLAGTLSGYLLGFGLMIWFAHKTEAFH